MSPRRPRILFWSFGATLACLLTGRAPALGQGVVVTPVGSGTKADRAWAATLLPSGGLFAAGSVVGTLNENHAAAIYPLFPTIGPPTVSTTYYNPQQNVYGNSDYAASAVASGNDVITAGVAYSYLNSQFVGNFAITWWNASGAYRKVETAFNPNKKGKPTTKSKAMKILKAPDGSLIAVGVDENPGTRLAFARYNATTGAVLKMTQNDIDFTPRAAAVLNNSVIVVGKSFTENHIAAVKLDLNGNVVTNWGTNGKVVVPVGSESLAEAVAIDGDNRIVIAGSAVFADRQAVVARLKTNGNIDATFNVTGYVGTDLGGAEDVFTAVNLRENGLIVATGYTSDLVGGSTVAKVAAAQFLPTGVLDAANFGVGGVTIVPVRDSALSYDSKIQADGRIVLVGEARTVVQVSPRLTNLDFLAVQLGVNGLP